MTQSSSKNATPDSAITEATTPIACKWDHVFADAAVFKHGSMGEGIYAGPGHDFRGMTFAVSWNFAGPDHSPGYPRAGAKMLGDSEID